ncbi:OsmC family protein [uncultured Georgenia sp.]|uniref:OsmC family protein n=1 Tax=uncultured Georgenia sp. TaxID=378209 RepID=UPI002609A86A|nr:OsmC family protein [uncultured Georgenia sp.]HLV03190.1 OsmC family protein [Actinomycetaceae bacterium]
MSQTTTPDDATTPPTDAPPARALWAERQGRPVYVARNERGAEVRIGSKDTEGVFSPGELLKVALAACTALSADHVLRSRLGDDFPAVVGVSSTGVEGENRYGHLDVELVLDLGDLEEERRAKLAERVDRTSGRLCTVGRTLKAGATYGVTLTHEPMREV